MLTKKTGKLMRQIRKEHKITMVEMAKAINISQPRLSRIEKGEQDISLDVLEGFCTYFNITPAFFMNELEREEPSFNLIDGQLKKNINNLTADQKNSLNMVIISFQNKNSSF